MKKMRWTFYSLFMLLTTLVRGCEWESSLSQGGSIQPDTILEVLSNDGVLMVFQGKSAGFGPCPPSKEMGEIKDLILFRPGKYPAHLLPLTAAKGTRCRFHVQLINVHCIES
jgi:hypothetical protein